jgi:prepilin signal peptidase PulO-like enzyme (type II secretory pathway)
MLCALAAWRFGGMGMGDVKLLTAVGVALGPVVGITAFALAAATGVAWHAAGAVRGPKRRARFAFAPFIAIAVAACLIAPRLLVALAAGHAA